MNWFLDKILPSLVSSIIAVVLASIWFIGSDYIQRRIVDVGQSWVPENAIMVVFDENCPRGGWQRVGRLAFEVENGSAAVIGNMKVGEKTIYQAFDRSDNSDNSVSGYDLFAPFICIKRK